VVVLILVLEVPVVIVGSFFLIRKKLTADLKKNYPFTRERLEIFFTFVYRRKPRRSQVEDFYQKL
jgi:uncharacterized protein YneF (UPF0154 family)